MRRTLQIGFALALAFGLACRGKASRSPEACLRNCDQERCNYDANDLADNDEYLECLESCEAECRS